MYPAAHGALFLHHGLRPGIRRHRHVVFRRHHKGDAMLVQPPQISAIQKTSIKDDFVQAGSAGQIGPGLGDQDPSPVGLMRLDLPDLDRQRHLGGRIDPQEHVPALDGDLDLMLPAAPIFDAPLTCHLATAGLALGRLQVGAIRNARDLCAKDLRLGQGPNRPIEHELQVPQIQLDDIVGQCLRADRPRSPLPLPYGAPPLAPYACS